MNNKSIKRSSPFSLKFNKQPNTLKKLTLIVAGRLYGDRAGSVLKKSERAKNFIRHHLCSACRSQYISNWNNDFKSMSDVICSACQSKVYSAFSKMSSSQNPGWLKRLKMHNLAKKKAIQFELEWRLKKPIDEILKLWHVENKLSTYAIIEKLQKEYNIHNISREGVSLWLDELGILRSHVKALRNRIVTKRMDFSKRKIDYTARKIDYALISKRKKTDYYKDFPAKKQNLVRLPDDLRDEINLIAEKSQRTSSEVIRDIWELAEKEKFPDSDQERIPKWMVIGFMLDKYREKLLHKRIKSKRGRVTVMAPLSSEREPPITT